MLGIIDYGMGNSGSIQNMLTRIGVESIITNSHADIEQAEKLIIPGVGAFDNAVNNLRSLDLIDILNSRVVEHKVPVLGICLGMQLFSKTSEEGTLPGLGWIDADTVKFRFPEEFSHLKIPHMGWDTIEVRSQSPILDNMFESPRFYFVHTYHVRCNRPENVLAVGNYGVEFHAAVIKENILGTQFHPEKSHKFGLRLLRNFVEA